MAHQSDFKRKGYGFDSTWSNELFLFFGSGNKNNSFNQVPMLSFTTEHVISQKQFQRLESRNGYTAEK